MFSTKLALFFILMIIVQSSCFYFLPRDIGTNQVSCSAECTTEEMSRLRANTLDMLTRKHQDRVISIRHFLNAQIRTFNEFFTKLLKSVHMDLDLMFTNTYGSFYQENIQILNDLFDKIRSFSVSFAETSMRTIVERFFDQLFQVMFNITNPFYSLTDDQRLCMQRFYREIEAFDDIPQKISNQLSLPLTNWKQFLGSMESLHNILDGYLNITLKDECERGLTRMETCAQCRKVTEKPCHSYCVNILSGCTHQMLDSEEAWKATTESMIKLSNQLNNRQNLVSALLPIPILISEAVMHFQEKRDYITNKIIGKCLLNKEDFGLRKKRHSTTSKHLKSLPAYGGTSRKSRDHLILNQMFHSFTTKMEEWQRFFGNVPEQLCGEEKWASEGNEYCWNGTDVGTYELPMVNYSQPFKNPEYQGTDFLSFRGSYVEERLRLHWLQSRIRHVLSGRAAQESSTFSHRAEAIVRADDEDYSDYDYEGVLKPKLSPHMHEENDGTLRSEEAKSDVISSPTTNSETESEESSVEEEKTDVNTVDLSNSNKKFGKEIGVICLSTLMLSLVIYILLSILGLSYPSRPLVVAKGAARPFFQERQRRLVEDNYDGTIRLSSNTTMSVILLYSPYSITSKQFREEYFQAARTMKKHHGDYAPFFEATNCFDSNNYCRRKYNLKQYPALMAQNYALMGSVYNGPWNALYVTRWLNRLQNAVFRIQTSDELVQLSKQYDVIAIIYYEIRTPPNTFQSATNFTKVAFHYLDGDPNTERTIFCIVTDPTLASSFQLHNEHDVVLVSSDLKLLSTHYKGWSLEEVYNDVVRYSQAARQYGVEFLNLGRRFSSTQLAEKMNQGSVLLYFTPNIIYGNDKYTMFRDTARDYLTCPEKDMISIPEEEEEEKKGHWEDYLVDCSVSLKSTFCQSNTTLSFMMIDSRVENQLSAKLGAIETDMVIAVNAKQEITRFIQNNITRESINCLIRQHHNAADNEFVSESSRIQAKQEHDHQDQHPDSVGEASDIRFVSNVRELLESRKINVIMFSGGIWHSASSSAISPFHLVANYFKESRSIIDFSMVDVSQTYVPYNLDFEKLPKILITSADSVGLSWTYPEDFMINHTNIVRFVLSRPGKIFERLRWLNSCQGTCRKTARWEMRSERLQLKREQSRNVPNSMRQRTMIGYYDRMLRMMG
ncbi:unnamed protein product [Caenorhabditis sp. 36 PRJEB53466]|nr:unnamed protein product [Caenorhabditis sp. 36 PRJEB53466]